MDPRQSRPYRIHQTCQGRTSRPGRSARSAISTVAASPVRAGVIWVGTSNRIVQLTQDGGAHWKIVTPPGLVEPGIVKAIEPGRHDAATRM